MARTPNFDKLDKFLAGVEHHVPLSVFLPLAAEHGLLGPDDWQGWAGDQLRHAGHPDRWLTNLASAETPADVRGALSERTDPIAVCGYWGYYDLLEVGMRCLAERRGSITFAEVLAESTESLHHPPVELDSEAVVAAMNHAKGLESHPAEYMEARAVCRRLGDHALRLFTIVGLPLNVQPEAKA